MKIVAVMPVRNEDWVLGLSARAALMWVDHLVILDHASTDDTPDILLDITEEYPDRVTVLREASPVWEEMKHRQRLLSAARELGATHIALVDADEVLSGNLLPHGSRKTIWKIFRELPSACVLQLPWLCLRGSINRVHVSGPWADGQNVSTGFEDVPQLHWTSEGRGGYDFHHRHPMGRQCIPWTPIPDRSAGLMHLQFVSGRRLRAKQALYKITEVLRWPDREPVHVVNQRYNLAVYGNHSGLTVDMDKTLTDALDAWWKPYGHLMQYFHPHAMPWQEKAVLETIETHGPQRFAGLDLFGIGEPTHAR
jgi:hypothetical protein